MLVGWWLDCKHKRLKVLDFQHTCQIRCISGSVTKPVSDPAAGWGAVASTRPPTDQNFLNFMQFFGNFAKIIGLRPLLRRILDPPLGGRQETWNLCGYLWWPSFYDLFLQCWGKPWPPCHPSPHPWSATGKQTQQDIFSEQIRQFPPACA